MSASTHVSQRLRPFGTTIFAEMTALATRHQAINLAQGFPDFDGPETAKAAARLAIEQGHAQYARMIGVPALNQAIADTFSGRTGIALDPDAHVTVTSGCTEAIAAAMLGLINSGDEVILFEPFYDSYRACVALAGATPRFVTLRPPASGAGSFSFDPASLEQAFTPRTRAILVNTPHNPTGKVFTRAELEVIASLCRRHNVVALTDEVYEHLTYDPARPHISLASLEGMFDRTVTLSSLGKSFSLTGWKIGWAIAPPPLTAAVRAAHQFLTFATATPLQHGAAAILREPGTAVADAVALFKRNTRVLSEALTSLGMTVFPVEGAYFLMADHGALGKRLGVSDDRSFCQALIERVKVAAIPPSVFYDTPEHGRSLVRFACCKKASTIDEAVRRLHTLI